MVRRADGVPVSALAMLELEPAPVDEFDLDEPTRPDALAAAPMRALVFGDDDRDSAVRR